MSIQKDKKTGTFLLEEDLAMKPDFDIRLEKLMGNIPNANVLFDYTYKPEYFVNNKHPPARKKVLKMLETHNLKQFKAALSDSGLIKDLKKVLDDLLYYYFVQQKFFELF